VSSKDVRAVLPEIDPFSANDTRNRALVLLAYAGSLQSAELIGLHIGDLTFRPRGLVVDVAGDQVVIRSSRHIEADPITAVRAWVRLLRTRHRDTSAVDPLFRRVDPHDNVGKEPLSKTSPNGVVKRLTPALTCAVLARGLIAEAKNLGVPPEALERHTRRQGELDERFEDALVHKVGL
jgi:integrase